MKRFLVLAALLAACLGLFAAWPTQAQQRGTIIAAQCNPYLVEFVARQSKRSDLRLNVARLGLDTAFSRWLSVEHPYAYRNAVRLSAFHSMPSGMKTATRMNRASGSCCIMAAGCCPMCPTCCAQKNCTKGCCNLSACTMRPNCCTPA